MAIAMVRQAVMAMAADFGDTAKAMSENLLKCLKEEAERQNREFDGKKFVANIISKDPQSLRSAYNQNIENRAEVNSQANASRRLGR